MASSVVLASMAGEIRAAAGPLQGVITSVARSCHGDFGNRAVRGSLAQVSVSVGHGVLEVRFAARRPWNVDPVARSGPLQWEFVEWVPHHRPIIEDNHGGTEFRPGQTVLTARWVSSKSVYFSANGTRIVGRYHYSQSTLELEYSLARLHTLGVGTPFVWTASFGGISCQAVLER